jgi:hypothetical protein
MAGAVPRGQFSLQTLQHPQRQLQEQKEKKQRQHHSQNELLPTQEKKKPRITWKDLVQLREALQVHVPESIWREITMRRPAPQTAYEYYSSDSSTSSDSDIQPRIDYLSDPRANACPVGYNPIQRVTLCHELHKISEQAKDIEIRLTGYNYRFSTLELKNYQLQATIDQQEAEMEELEHTIGLRTFDLCLHKNLVEYYEHSRTSLCNQLSYTTHLLTQASIELGKANETIAQLRDMVKELLRNTTKWE